MAKKKSEPAYYLVDISALTPEQRAEVFEDAVTGGGDYGVEVVEIVHNGPSQTPLYGVYYGEKHELWVQTKEEWGISDDDVLSEDELREAAEQRAADEAAAADAAEAAELAKAGVEPGELSPAAQASVASAARTNKARV